jgi:hypothetical protein
MQGAKCPYPRNLAARFAHFGSRPKRPLCVFCCLGLFLEGVADNAICRSLRIGGGMNDKPVMRLQLANPVLDVGCGVAVGMLVGNAGNAAKACLFSKLSAL